jgi:hypothetical protein
VYTGTKDFQQFKNFLIARLKPEICQTVAQLELKAGPIA